MNLGQQFTARQPPGRGSHRGAGRLVEPGPSGELLAVDRHQHCLQEKLETRGDAVQLVRSGAAPAEWLVKVQKGTGTARGVRQSCHEHVQWAPAFGIRRTQGGRHVSIAAEGSLQLDVHVLLSEEDERPVPGSFATDLFHAPEGEALTGARTLARATTRERHLLDETVAAEHVDGTGAEAGPASDLVGDPTQLGPHRGAAPAAATGTIR